MKALLSLIVLLLGGGAFAQTNVTNLDINEGVSKSVLLPKDLTVRVGMGFAGTVSDESQSEGSRTATLSLTPTYKFNKDYRITASASVTQEYEIERVFYSNTRLTLYLPTWTLLNDSITVYPSVAGSLPTNNIAYRDESFRGALSGGASFTGTLLSKTFPVSVYYNLSGGRNLHKFRRNNLRTANTEYFISHSLGLTKGIKKASITLAGTLNPAWDYNGDYEPTYSLSQTLSYAADNGVLYNLSHATGGRALDYRGDFSNVDLLDDYRSRISFNLVYTIK